MNSKLEKVIYQNFNADILCRIKELEKSFDIFFLKDKKLKKSEYTQVKKIINRVIVEEIVPLTVKLIAEEVRKESEKMYLKKIKQDEIKTSN
jgi:hypothetical protein